MIRIHFDDKGNTSMASQAMAIWFGVVPDDKRSLAAVRLKDMVVENKYHPATGFGSTVSLLGIWKSLPGVVALAGADLAARAGRVHAVVGENGAGKATLMKVLGGVCQPDAGTVEVGGQAVRFRSPHQAIPAGISVIGCAVRRHGHALTGGRAGGASGAGGPADGGSRQGDFPSGAGH